LASVGGTEQAEQHAPISAIEAALLTLAAFFFTSSLTRHLWMKATAPALAWWFLANLAPPLLMLAGAVLIIKHFPGLLPGRGATPRVIMMSLGGVLLGVAGGMAVGATHARYLAAPLNPRYQLLWAIAWVGVLAPVIEEVYFRGVLQGALLERLGRPSAVLLAAAAFALAHQGIPSLATSFVLGLGFGMLAASARSLVPAISAHIAWNLGTVWLATIGVSRVVARDLAVVGIVCLLTALVAFRAHREDDP